MHNPYDDDEHEKGRNCYNYYPLDGMGERDQDQEPEQPPETRKHSKVIQLNPEYDALLKKMMIQKKMKERMS